MCGICTPKTVLGGVRKATKIDIIAPLGVDESSEWCNSLVIVPKANGKV